MGAKPVGRKFIEYTGSAQADALAANDNNKAYKQRRIGMTGSR
jgi:hypothetical protein